MEPHSTQLRAQACACPGMFLPACLLCCIPYMALFSVYLPYFHEPSLTRASNRLQVTQMARAMVVNYGFSDIGPWSLMDQGAQSQDMIMRMMSRNSISESLQRKIDDAVKALAAEAYVIALQHIRSEQYLSQLGLKSCWHHTLDNMKCWSWMACISSPAYNLHANFMPSKLQLLVSNCALPKLALFSVQG